MNMAKDEVLVVGAGPVGLAAAAELTRHGVKCRIIDETPSQIGGTRAAVIHARTLEVFEDMGILSPILEKGVKVIGINLYSQSSRLIHTEYKEMDSPYCFMIDLPQSQTERILIHHLENLGVKVQRNTKLNNIEHTENGVDVMLKQGESNLVPDAYAYVIGCDGADSTCRDLLEIPFPGSEYPDHWAVFDAKLDIPYDTQEIHIFLHEKGLLACFPLPEGRMRIICELQQEKEPTFELMREILKQRLSKDMKILQPSDLNLFTIHHRQATMQRKGRVFLAGNAAHLHSPVGGQGMNIGIQDVYNLAWKLALVHQGKAPPSLLDTYHQERYPIAQSVLSITDKLTKMITTKSPFLTLLRDATMSIAGTFDKLKEQLPKRFSQLYLRYDPSHIIVNNSHNHPPEKIHIGTRIPDHTVKREKEDVRLFELFKGTHHTLLLFGGKKASKQALKKLETLYNTLKNHPLIHTYILYRNEENLTFCPNPKHCLFDHEPSAHSHFGIIKSTAILIRPDGYIGYIQEPLDKETFNNYLGQIFK
jgi:2-polyprenyl-6-methoxyphenol hydroxylase-like FAD-dependent oxidoreductase